MSNAPITRVRVETGHIPNNSQMPDRHIDIVFITTKKQVAGTESNGMVDQFGDTLFDRLIGEVFDIQQKIMTAFHRGFMIDGSGGYCGLKHVFGFHCGNS